MGETQQATLLRIFVGEDEVYDGHSLYEAIVNLCRSEGIAGASVFRGQMGYGASSKLHTSHVLRLSENLPVVIEVVDSDDAISALLPQLDGMIGEGLVTTEKVSARRYRRS